MEFIRPNILRKAILYLKNIGNPHYVNVNLNEGDIFNQDESNSGTSSSSNSDIDTSEIILENVSRFQSKNSYSTCFVPENPEDYVFFNKTTDTIRKILKHQTEGIEVFPGEGRIPCNWLKEENFDF